MQNWVFCRFKAKSELSSGPFKFCLHVIHIQSYNSMMLSSSILLYTSIPYLPTLKSQKSDSAMRSEQASVASALRPGVQGPAQGPLVGSRGNAPVGVKGAKPPEAPGLVHFKIQ